MAVLSFLLLTPRHGLAQESASGLSVTLNEPTCGMCGWLVEGREVVEEDDTLWFAAIAGIDVGPRGVLWASDLQRQQLLRVDLRAGSASAFGRPGEGPGEFQLPATVAVGPRGDVYVYDVRLRRISRFGNSGEFKESFPIPVRLNVPSSMAVDTTGMIYVAGLARAGPQRNYLIHKIDSAGGWVKSFLPARPEETRISSTAPPAGGYLVFDDRRAELWFARASNAFELSVFSANGEELRRYVLSNREVGARDPGATLSMRGGVMRVEARALTGMVGLTPINAGYLLALFAREDLALTYDIIRSSDGQVVATWTDRLPRPYFSVDASGEGVQFHPVEPPNLRRVRIHPPTSGRR